MYSRKEVPCNAASLAFTDPELEAGFRTYYFEKNAPHFRMYLLLGFLLYALLGIPIEWITQGTIEAGIRFPAVSLLLLGIFLFSCSGRFFSLLRICLLLAGITVGAEIVFTSVRAFPPETFLYYAGLPLCLLFYFRLPFSAAAPLALCVFLFYEAAILTIPEIPAPVLLAKSFIIFSFLTAGAFLSYRLERFQRFEFLFRQPIRLRNYESNVAKRPYEKKDMKNGESPKEVPDGKEQLSRARKAAAVGRLAGGIAHEFNNILTAVIGYANYLQMKMDKNDPLHPYTGNIIISANKAAYLANELLAFSRKKQMKQKAVDLNSLLLKTEDFLPLILGGKFTTTFTTYETPLPVLADEILLEEVLVNIAADVRDALPEGGFFSVVADRVEPSENSPPSSGAVEPGVYGRITVTITGRKKEKTERESIVETSSTINEADRETELGLSMAYEITGQHNGFVRENSRSDGEKTVNLFLPLISEG